MTMPEANRGPDPSGQDLALRDPLSARIAALLARPVGIAVACIVVLSAAGWLAIGLLAALDPSEGGMLAALCRPMLAGRVLTMTTASLVLLMWVAMTLAMMLPTAGPMVLTYAEIADTAWRKGERVVSPLVLVAGYLAVWLVFATSASAIQLALMRLGANLGADVPARWAAPVTTLLFVSAGLYQFSDLKRACLTACQSTFPFFFQNWSDRAAGIFRLGLRQGLHCLGCCWAMMALMLATGTMNVAWMAGLGVVMVVEKISRGVWFSRAVGVALIAVGLAGAFAAVAGFQVN
jgi:predicted metal-binding membrane protein